MKANEIHRRRLMDNFQDKANFIWQVADDILRGTFKRHEYGEVILPFVVLRRMDCVYEKIKNTKSPHKEGQKKQDLSSLNMKADGKLKFDNYSLYDLKMISQNPKNIELNFNHYIRSYTPNVQEILENFHIDRIIPKLAKNDCLFKLVDKFTQIDLHPDKVSNHQMGYIFEELLRRFSEISNESAGEHYTPREVIRLMVNLLFAEHVDELKGKGIKRTVYDPACGTGGMLTIAKEHILTYINKKVEIVLYGQELNDATYAIAKSDVLIMEEDAKNIHLGSCFSNDCLKGMQFDFMLSNPPFGVSWKKEQEFITREAKDPNGRFHQGLPRVSDGAMLFLQHMLSKVKKNGSRIAIIFNGSPLTNGGAGSGESNIRKWIIENDWLEAIVALPTELFYNTGIATYIWIVTNRKPKKRTGKIQLINAVSFYKKMPKSLGSKRNYIPEEDIERITELYMQFDREESEYVKIFPNEYFGYTKVTIERPLQGSSKPDPKLRDYEKIPLLRDIDEYFEKEVRPFVPNAWMDRSKDRVGYEMHLNRYFFKYKPLRNLAEIQADILALEEKSHRLFKEILEW